MSEFSKLKYIRKIGGLDAVVFALEDKFTHGQNHNAYLRKVLAEGFRFVRVDLFLAQEGILFNEMTFTPAGGFVHWQPAEYDRILGEKWHLTGKAGEMPKISVIIPTHNRAELLPRAVKSVQSQTMPVSEIIIVSDGSDEATDEVVSSLAKEDSRIRYISYHPAKGGNFARNRGIEAATGEYLAFLDDDDEWLPLCVEKHMEVFAKDPEIGLVYAAHNVVRTEEGVTYAVVPHKRGDLSTEIFYHNDIGGLPMVIFKRSLLEKTGMLDESLRANQDYDLWIRMTEITKVDFTVEPCMNYYQSAGGMQVTGNMERYEEAQARLLEKYAERIGTLPEKTQKKIRASFEEQLAIRYLKNGYRKKARAAAKRAWKYHKDKKAVMFFLASFVPMKTMMVVRRKIGLKF